jgi:hypothetical protein
MNLIAVQTVKRVMIGKCRGGRGDRSGELRCNRWRGVFLVVLKFRLIRAFALRLVDAG